MATAGVPTGAAKALAEVGGNARPMIWQLLLSAPSERRASPFATRLPRTSSMVLRSAGMGHSANYHAAAAHSLAVRGYDSLALQPGSARAASRHLAAVAYASLEPGFHRASSRRHAFRDYTSMEPRFLRASSAGIGYCLNLEPRTVRAATPRHALHGDVSLYLEPRTVRAASRRLAVDTHASIDPRLARAPSRRRAAHDSASLDLQPRFLRASSTAVPNVLKPMCSTTTVDETSEDPKPEVPTRWAKVVALLTKLNIAIIKLLLLGLSIWTGMLAVKEDPTATHIVNVCDKCHKVYNIASKGFLVIVELLKGDNK